MMKNIVIHLSKMKQVLFALIIVGLFSCSKDDETIILPLSANSPNILLIILDDVGKDAINGFSEGNIKPNTPHIDSIRNSGLTYNKFWAYPTCSPTRASIITGKYGYRTGIKWADDEISSSETILQEHINNYATAIVGKWHLSANNTSINPESFGIDYYAGIFNGAVQSYYNWQLTEDGVNSTVTEYTTKKLTDLSIDWIQAQDKPWFMWLAYNAPHTPFHIPPNGMHNQGNLPNYTSGLNPTPYYMASIEALDYQIGRLLDNIPDNEKDNTVIIIIGDNGTPYQVVQSPYTNASAKGTLYQGGINTPMFISGVGVSRTGEDNSLLTSSDLFATISEIAGVPTDQIHDSKSFKPLFTQSSAIRNFQYSEMNDGTDDAWAISNGSYKLIENANGSKEFYDLANDPYEQNNLLNGTLTTNETNAKTELETELQNIRQ